MRKSLAVVGRILSVTALALSSGGAAVAQLCAPGVPQAYVGGLHWPSTGCSEATALAENNLTGMHYRNACKELLQGDLPDGVLGVEVLECVEDGGAKISVAVCCDASYYSNEACPYSMEVPCSGSGASSADNSAKYEYYRRRLFCDFVYLCPDPSCQGCSLPANERASVERHPAFTECAP